MKWAVSGKGGVGKSTLTAALALAMLQPVKGAVIGYQWAKRLHGFGDEVAE